MKITMASTEYIIEAGRTDSYYFQELWQARRLVLGFVWRDIVSRYRYTVLGVAWRLVSVLLSVLVFTVVFGRLAKLPSHGVPYPLLVFLGLMPWQFITSAITSSTNSLRQGRELISKVYFPKLVLPISAILTSLVDLIMIFPILVGMFVYYGILPGWQALMAPVFLVYGVLTVLAAGLWLSALAAKYRDISMLLPFFLQIGLFLSPVGYSGRIIPGNWSVLYFANPATIVIEGLRWSFTGNKLPYSLDSVIISMVIVGVLLWTGFLYFRSVERTIVDTL